MKKLKLAVVAATITISCGLSANAQEKGTIELGGGIGLNISQVRAESIFVSEKKNGFNASISGEYYFSDRWGVKIKLIYDQKGWGDGVYIPETEDSFVTDYKLNYLTIPLMANWHFSKKRSWYLNFGPYIGVLLNAETEKEGIDVKDDLKGSDFGIAAGIGYKLSLNDTTKLYLEYEEQYGLAELTDDGIFDLKNSRGSFNLGVLFVL